MGTQVMPDTRLHQAVWSQNYEAVRSLLLNGEVNINAKENVHGHTALHLAADVGHKKIMKLLVTAAAPVNIDVDAKDKNDLTPLYIALRWNDVDLIKILIDAGADINFLCTKNRKTALHYSVKSNNPMLVNYLISREADVNLKDGNKFTPLHYVGLYNQNDSHFEVAEILLRNEADVHVKDEFGSTPLYRLIWRANFKIVELFLKYNSDVNAKGKSGHIPLFEAICIKNFQVIQLLIDYGSDVNRMNTVDGSTSFHWACYHCDKKIIKYLLKNNADINALDKQNLTPLNYTINSALSDIIDVDIAKENLKFLLEYSDIQKIGTDGEFILDFNNNESLSKTILEHLAKLHLLLNMQINPIINALFGQTQLQLHVLNYLQNCFSELEMAKKTKLSYSWITLYSLLAYNKKTLKNCAKNKSIIKEFSQIDFERKFPIYGTCMLKIMEKAIKHEKMYHQSTEVLINHFPILRNEGNSLIIKDILDCVTSTKDLSILSQ